MEAYWPKSERPKLRDSTQVSPPILKKTKAFIFDCNYHHKRSIITHHKKSASISHSAKSQAILPLELLFTNVSNLQSTHFYVENIAHFFFFLPLYRVIKNKLRQDASNRNLQAVEQPPEVFDSTDSGSASGSRFLSVSGILHWWEGKRRRRFQMMGVSGRQVSSAPPPPLQSPNFSLPNLSSLALRLAD